MKIAVNNSSGENIGDKNFSEINLKRKLVEATDAVRKKFNFIKNRNTESQLTLEKIYDPITKPLKVISEATEARSKIQSIPAQHVSLETFTRSPSVRSASSSPVKSTPVRYRDNRNVSPLQISSMDTPPSSLITTPSPSTSFSGKTEKIHSIAMEHIRSLKDGDSSYDTVYGVHVDPDTGKLQMGSAEIRFSGENIVFWRGNTKLATYHGNHELYDLIFLRLPPNLAQISNANRQTYGEILKVTNSPYKNYDINRGVNTSRSRKYCEIIKPLTSYKIVTRSKKEGLGLPTNKIYKNKPLDYVYWNKPKELVDRLRLLWSSKQAGHTGHDNEILSIISELREENIIY